jgi:hypothetical protein
MKVQMQQQAGWTRWEVAALILCGVVLLVVVVLPLLARPKHGKYYAAVSCRNNLRQVGLSFRLWANDFDGEYPFASTNAAGSWAWANTPQVFRHYQALSNELVIPKVLHCRADWSRSASINFISLSNTNLSYFVGLDAQEDTPNSILTGDRFLNGGTLSNGFLRVLVPNTPVEWTKEIHPYAGNIGLGDGSAQTMTGRQLQKHLTKLTNGTIRLAVP